MSYACNMHALQGHPEAPRLWETNIHAILVKKLHFVPTTHEKCLYSKRDSTGALQLFLRQVDNFLVAATDRETCMVTIFQVGSFLQVPRNGLGLIKKFKELISYKQSGLSKFLARII